MGKKASAHFYLKSMIYPVLNSIAQNEHLSIVEEVAKMIDGGVTIGEYARRPEYGEKLEDTLGSPTACFVIDKFRGHLEKPEHEIRASVPWWLERIRETRPEIHAVISSRPGGEKWLGDTFVDITKLCLRFGSRP